MSFYIVLSGKTTSFSSHFTKTYNLRGEWEVAVTSSIINGESKAKMYWTMCDVADYSYVNDIPMQLVDIMLADVKKSIKPMYVKVIKKRFSSINIELKQDPNKEEEISALDITCILHFRKA